MSALGNLVDSRAFVGQTLPPLRLTGQRKASDIMADRRSLQWIGVFYACITIAITLVASVVVSDHVSGRISLETSQAQASEVSTVLR